MAGLDLTVGPVAVHRAVDNMNQVYKQYGFLDNLPPVLTKSEVADWDRSGIIIALPGNPRKCLAQNIGPVPRSVCVWLDVKSRANTASEIREGLCYRIMRIGLG